MGWPRIEVAVRTLEDELSVLRAQAVGIPPGRSPHRLRLRAAIEALDWVRHGGAPPHERLLHGAPDAAHAPRDKPFTLDNEGTA